MKSLFLEPFSGLSGDMLNGLLLDLGGDLNKLLIELKNFPSMGSPFKPNELLKVVFTEQISMFSYNMEKRITV